MPPSIQSLPSPPNTVSADSPAKIRSAPAPPKVSVGSDPPTTKSAPVPPWFRSKPGPDAMASLPGPPLMTSSPKLSLRRSLPRPPIRLSLPAPPSTQSAPPLPRIVSSPSLENIRSSTGGEVPVSTPLNTTCSGPPKRTVPAVGTLRVRSWFSFQSGVVASSRIGPLAPRFFIRKMKSGREKASAGRPSTSELRMISSASELPSSWTSRLCPARRVR